MLSSKYHVSTTGPFFISSLVSPLFNTPSSFQEDSNGLQNSVHVRTHSLQAYSQHDNQKWDHITALLNQPWIPFTPLTSPPLCSALVCSHYTSLLCDPWAQELHSSPVPLHLLLFLSKVSFPQISGRSLSYLFQGLIQMSPSQWSFSDHPNCMVKV